MGHAIIATSNSSMAYHFVLTCAYSGQSFVKIMTGFFQSRRRVEQGTSSGYDQVGIIQHETLKDQVKLHQRNVLSKQPLCILIEKTLCKSG